MTKEIYKEETVNDQLSQFTDERKLILINDEEHSFEYVIDALMDVCNHSPEQATQCTMITHYKGECDVKKGHFKDLRKMRHGLIDRKLRAKIN